MIACEYRIFRLIPFTGMEYFITTERLGFCLWRQDDLPLAMALWGDAEVSALIGGPFTVDQVRSRLDCEIAQMHVSGMQYWPLFSLEDDEFVGCAGLRPKSLEKAQLFHLKRGADGMCGDPRVLELGYLLLRAHRGRGLACEASRAAIEYGFGTLNADAIFAGHHPANEASKRVLLKLGFKSAGDEFYPPTGMFEPTYLLHKS